VSVENLSGTKDSPAGVLRVWADEPPGTLDCNNIAPKSTSAKVGSISPEDAKSVLIKIKAPATAGIHTLKVFLDTCKKNAAYTAEATLEYEVITPRPDLGLRDARFSTQVPAVGQEYKLALTVLNWYSATGPNLKPFRIRLYFDTPEGFVPTCNQTDYAASILSAPITKKIGVGKEHTYTFTLTARDTPGDTNVTIFIDSNCEVNEDDEENNVGDGISFTVMPAPRLPDLWPELSSSLPAVVKAGKAFKLKLKVWNFGNEGGRP